MTVRVDTQAAKERAEELLVALEDPARWAWGDGPWEHLGAAERDVLPILRDVLALVGLLADAEKALPREWCRECRVSGMKPVRQSEPVRCPRVEFDCGHVAYIWPDEYGDGSAWCQACGEFYGYDRCRECFEFDCDHRETR